jgi:hypothetical protein
MLWWMSSRIGPMKNVVITVVVLVALLPFILMVLPKEVSLDRAKQAFTDNGLVVEYDRPVVPPALEAVEHLTMYVNGALVNIYRYDDEGKIAKNLEYQRPDSGTMAVEAMGIGVALGAAPSRNIPITAERNGKWMITIQDPDAALRQRIARVFKSL